MPPPHLRTISFNVPAPVRRQLAVMAAEQEREMRDVLCEALNLLFERHGKEQIAPRFPTIHEFTEERPEAAA